MDSLRLWILGVAAGSFAAGLIVGGILPGVRAGARSAQEDVYVVDLRDRYGLSDAQVRQLRMVLQKQAEEEMAIFLGAQQSQLPLELMSPVLATRNRTKQRIRMVLDDEQRARYDEDCRPPDSEGPKGGGEAR